MDNQFNEALEIADEVLGKNEGILAAYYIKAITLVSLKKHAKSI